MSLLTSDSILEQRLRVLEGAKALLANPEATTEDVEQGQKMFEDAQAMMARSKTLAELEGEIKAGIAPAEMQPLERKTSFKRFGDYLRAVYAWKFGEKKDPSLTYISPGGQEETKWSNFSNIPKERKDLVENIGADGGFLVFPEYRPQLMMMTPFGQYVRDRATVLPMASRQLIIPTLDQTGTTSGQSNFFGGVVPAWTEEATEKEETQPEFRQADFIAHKLVVYTEASDELLADSEIPLESLLTSLMAQAIAYELDNVFIQGTGAGQPLGVINAGATFVQARAAAGAISIVDVFNMLEHFMGQTPIWLAHQSTMPSILQLNGPAGNPSYVWISNAAAPAPATLMGYPIFFIENCPTLGTQGDLILADWSKYIIGQRQQVLLDSSKHYRFRYDLTVWRAVARFAGRPWLSAPITLRDGVTQVSPFVILGDVTGS